MKIINSDFLRFSQIENRKLPKLEPEINRLVDEWAFSNDTTTALSGKEILEKIMALVTDDTFYLLYHESKPFNYTFDVKTTQLNPITIRIVDGGYGEPDAIYVSDEHEEYKYNVIVLQEEETLQVTSTEKKNLDTGFTQYYNKHEDTFSKPDKNMNIKVTIQNPSDKCEDLFYLIDDEVKEEFKKRKFKNVVDVYHFIVNRAFPTSHTFTIVTTDKETNRETGKIEVVDGIVRHLKYENDIRGRKYKIDQSFDAPTLINDPEFIAKQDQILKLLIGI